MDEKELRKHRCCFTGHRPEKLNIPEERLVMLLEDEIWKAIGNGFTTYITGMAKGTDLIAGEIILRMREQDPRLKLICALPPQALDCIGAAAGRSGSNVSWSRQI